MNSLADHQQQPFALAKPPRLGWLLLLGCGLLLVFVSGVVAWSFLATMDGAALSQGKLIVEQRLQAVEHLEGGIVAQLHITDGQHVVKDQLLVELEDTQARTTKDLLDWQYYELLAALARYRAESLGQADIDFPHELLTLADQPELSQIMQTQVDIFQARAANLERQKAILHQQLSQLAEEQTNLHTQVSSEQQALAYIQEELAMLEKLHQQNFVDKAKVLGMKRQAAGILAEIGEHMSMVARSEQRHSEISGQLLALDDQRLTESLERIRETLAQLGDISQRRLQAQAVLARTQIIAPSDGFVHNLQVFTQGDVITPGQRLMDIVPNNSALMIEAEIALLDIDVVQPGMVAKINFTAFNQREHPPLQGTVVSVSADSLTNQQTGAVYYLAHIKISPQELAQLADWSLTPGMPVQVAIVVEQRTPFNYLTAPITGSFKKAFKEI